MRIFLGFVLSLFIDFVLILITIATFKDWPSICFFVVCSWPLIWMCIILSQVESDERVDMIKLQNYFNLAAVRRNTDRMTNGKG